MGGGGRGRGQTMRPAAPAPPVGRPEWVRGLRADPLALHLLAAPIYALWAWVFWEPDAAGAGLMLVM